MTTRQEAIERAVRFVQFMAQYTEREIERVDAADMRAARDEAREIMLELAVCAAVDGR